MTTADLGDMGELILELCEPLGPCRLRKMFGGYGLFCGNLMFGLIADGVLHFKTDGLNRSVYEDLGLQPFTYETKNGRKTAMSYHQAPEALVDEPERFQDFAREALEAARRQARSAPPKPRAPRRPPAARRRR